ncbi:MAG TPA: DinB family protein [Deinococcales bacterium]|nr:DinB family protein [Deinococcales bacterium]
MSDKAFLEGLLFVLREALEGGVPGQGTAFLDGTKADGSGNNGLLAVLDGLTAEQASDPTVLGTSIASHAAHVAYHLEVGVRWEQGDRGPFDWKGSFQPAVVDDAGWQATRERLRTAYTTVVEMIRRQEAWDEPDKAGWPAAALAHVCYHLGAVRQQLKLVR